MSAGGDTPEPTNEIGAATPRGRQRLNREDVEADLSAMAGKEIRLPPGAVATSGPSTCPACGSGNVMWGCDPDQSRSRDEIHPLVWDETEWMADSYICRDCQAGWIEPDEPEPITWVRPYWRV
jgi:hypothetical protein